jgi:hypothetical protein
MDDKPTDPATTWSNILQVLVVIGAIAGGFFVLFVVSSMFRHISGKVLILGVPIAMAAAVAVGRKK